MPKKNAGRPAGETPPEPSISARPTPDLSAALNAYLKSVRPRTTRSAVILDALETYLQAKGFWPPPKTSD